MNKLAYKIQNINVILHRCHMQQTNRKMNRSNPYAEETDPVNTVLLRQTSVLFQDHSSSHITVHDTYNKRCCDVLHHCVSARVSAPDYTTMKILKVRPAMEDFLTLCYIQNRNPLHVSPSSIILVVNSTLFVTVL